MEAQTATGSAQGARVPLPVVGGDPGPMARLEEVKRDGSTMLVIANRVAEGESLKSIARAWGVPHGALQLWIMEDDTRMTTYRNARVAAGFGDADDAVAIADGVVMQAVDPEGKPLFDEAGKPVLVEPDVARDKLRSDSRRWRAQKNAPEFFGERLDVQMHRALPSEETLLAQLNALVTADPRLLDQLIAMRGNAALPVGVTITLPADTGPDASQSAESARPAAVLPARGSAQAEGFAGTESAPNGALNDEKGVRT